MAEMLNVQVCYASEELQFLRSLQVAAGTTLEQAVRQAGYEVVRSTVEYCVVDSRPSLDAGWLKDA